ncbi:hypothetical protein N7510_008267 [Penicillium lagena]|uniref:uncharacterized protein n=1 Tax=Penicillium lagena TaxID=94218 RepID=UPI002540754C|nr:uncharacterized protein N7510_008267 [Penicillium lagena]KAJ5605486.1 hypothetical protein N7510_008267 [Penicillium lagena]
MVSESEYSKSTSWIPFSDLATLIGKKTANFFFNEAWKMQEQRYILWQSKVGRDSPDREPSTSPLDLYDGERNVGRSVDRVRDPQNSTRIPDFGRSTQGHSLNPRKSNSTSKNVRFDDASSPPQVQTKQEDDDSDAQLFVKQDSDEQSTFSRSKYLEDLFKRKGWDKLSGQGKIAMEAKALAHYHVYREEILVNKVQRGGLKEHYDFQIDIRD